MREFEQEIPNWKQQVESAIFYPGRKGDINNTGTQFSVYTLPGIDFVVKIPLDQRWMNGYRLVEDLAPECAIPFVETTGLKLNINRIKTTIPEAIVQLKVKGLISELEDIFKTKDIERFKKIARKQMENDRELFSSGLFVPDPSWVNFGVDKDGGIKTFDLGSARTSFLDDIEFSNFARSRGHVHFATFFFLQTIEDDLKIPEDYPNKPSDLYGKFMRLPPAHPKGSTLNEMISRQEGKVWDPNISMFCAQIGYQEFVDFSPNGPPFKINEQFVRNLPASALSAGATTY